MSEGSSHHCRKIDINPMTLKLEGDQDIPKMYHQTENEVARLRHSKLPMMDEISMVNEKYQNNSMLKVKVKCLQLPTSSSIHRGAHLYQVISISNQ